MRMVVKLVVLLLCVRIAGFGQEPATINEDSIWLGTTLKLGMPKDEAVNELSKSYRLQKVDTVQDAYILLSKDGPPYDSAGVISFNDGKLAGVQKSWGPSDQRKGVEFARGLYMALNSLVRDKRQDCWITAKQQEVPKTEVKSGYIVCGNKHVSFSVIRLTGEPEEATVSENLGSPPNEVAWEYLLHEIEKKYRGSPK